MASRNDTGLSNRPIIIIIGLIASGIAIFVFITGKESIREILVSSTPVPVVRVQPTPTPECFRTTELGPWTTMGNVLIDAREPPGWVQADFWSPARPLKEGCDEVSVIFEPGLKIEVVGVAGNGWKYSSEWTRQDVEQCTIKHINDSWNIRHKRLILITVDELCAMTVCR